MLWPTLVVQRNRCDAMFIEILQVMVVPGPNSKPFGTGGDVRRARQTLQAMVWPLVMALQTTVKRMAGKFAFDLVSRGGVA